MTITWTFTDIALDRIDHELARPAPERGGVLLGPPNARLITDFLLDPVDGGAVEYFHSDQLRLLQRDRLAADPAVTYRGSIHSHPAYLAAPSGPDHRAFASALRRNPALGDMVFPIVVGRAPEQLAENFRGEHLVRLEHGCLAAFSGFLDGQEARVSPAGVALLPVGALSKSVAVALDAVVARIEPAAGPGGSTWMRIVWSTSDETTMAEALVPVGYPLAAPLIRVGADPRFTGLPWDPARDGCEQVSEELRKRARGMKSAARVPVGDSQDTPKQPAAELRDDLHARTRHHLPVRADWHVALLGAGSVGSVMLESLVRSGIPRLTVVDPDRVEGTNLSRTVYVAEDIGSLKVEALARRAAQISPDVLITPVAATVQDWLRGIDPHNLDLIVLATDDTLAELDVNAIAYPVGIPMVSVKMFAKGNAGEILFTHPASQTPCLHCLTGSRAAPAGREVDYGSGRLVAELALGPDIHSVSMKAVKIALALLALSTGTGQLTEWITPALQQSRTMILTANTAGWGVFAKLGAESVGLDGPYQTLWIPLATRNSECPVCGRPSSEEGTPGAAALDYTTVIPDDGVAEWEHDDANFTDAVTDAGVPTRHEQSLEI